MSTLTKKRQKKKAVAERRETFGKVKDGIDLCESLDLQTANGSVDFEHGWIRGVKVLSKHSTNKHGMPGVDGTDYELPAQEQLKEILESGMEVNVKHPPRDQPDMERDPDDRNGVLKNPRIINGETVADWKLLKAHPMTARILESANDPDLHSQFALSINARGYGTVKNRRYCVTEFLPTPSSPDKCIRSVDLVTRGGANRNIFESQEGKMKTKLLKDIVAASLAKPMKNQPKDLEKRWANLLEMYEDMGDTAVEEPAPAADAPAEDLDWKAHLGNLLKAIANDPEMPPDQIRAKITAALKCLDEGDDNGEGDAEVTEEDEDQDEENDKEAMESRQLAELKQLRDEKNVRELVEALELAPLDSKQVGIVAKIDSHIDRVRKIREFGKAKKQNHPRTATARDTFESRSTASLPNFDDRSEEARKKRLAAIK